MRTVNQYYRALNLGGAPAAFLPTDLANLSAWWDFTDFSSLTLVSGNISQVNDKSGNLRHAAQAATASRPLYESAGLLGTYPCASFDGVDDWLEAIYTLATYPFTVFLVTNIGGYSYSHFFSSSRYHYMQSPSGNQAQIRGATTTPLINSTFNIVGNATIYATQLTASNFRMVGTSGGAFDTYDVNADHANAWINADRVFLGRLRVGTLGNVKISECIQYNAALSNSEIIQVFSYLSNKYGGLAVPTTL
jgi:hypothetical protein